MIIIWYLGICDYRWWLKILYLLNMNEYGSFNDIVIINCVWYDFDANSSKFAESLFCI